MENKKRKSRNNVQNKDISVRLPEDYPWKVLDQLILDLDYLLDEDLKYKLHGIVRKRDHAAYLGLSEDFRLQCKNRSGMHAAKFRAYYQVISLLKKFRFQSESSARKANATNKFLAAEQNCADFNRLGFLHLVDDSDPFASSVLKYSRRFLDKLLGEILPSNGKLTEWSRHGPGANLDTKFGNTSLYFKYSEWPYSCTQAAVQEARSLIQSDDRWLGALEDDYRERNNIPRHSILNQDAFWTNVFRVVDGNRIAFVPKNAQTDRSIAIEPAMNLKLQLGVDGFIRRRLKRWGVDLDSQTKNRLLAREGSLHHDSPNSLVTIDLAAASDTISTRLCQLVLPSVWYDYLMKIRSPKGDLDGGSISYEKISSMGNGYTFALESAIFTSVIYGVTRTIRGSFDPRRFAVYGDDLIIEKDLAPGLITALKLFGFMINEDKSFLEGPFRESCGADWFHGKAVRPVFLTAQPSTVMGLFTDLNRLKRILSLRWMIDESHTEKRLYQWIPQIFRNYIGPLSDTDFDSYRHSAYHNGKHDNCLWRFRRLVIKPAPVKGNKFLFRKLMHDLRGRPQLALHHTDPQLVWRDGKLTASGSRFTITRKDRVIVGASYSVADYWRSRYTESEL